jgi:hypothetical protein
MVWSLYSPTIWFSTSKIRPLSLSAIALVSFCLAEEWIIESQPIVTALFEEPTPDSATGYSMREYSLKKGELFYRFPKEGGHWSWTVIREEWYHETKSRLPYSVFEAG